MFTKRKEEGSSENPFPKSDDFQPGKAYMLIGGTEKEILTKCPGCGAGFSGPCQSACRNCSTVRKVFYVDVTDVKLLNSPTGEINTATSLVLPDEESVEISENSYVSEIVGGKVTIGFNCKVDLVVARSISTLRDPRLRAVIIADNGSGYFGHGAIINTLATGKNVSLEFGNGCRVQTLLTMGGLALKAGPYFEQDNRKNTNYSEIAQLISSNLNS